MDILIKHIQGIMMIDRPTIIIICVLCALAAYFTKEYLANPPMIIFVYPVLVLFSVLIQYVFILLELYSVNKLDQWLTWTIMAGICGNIAGLALIAWLASLRDGAASRRA